MARGNEDNEGALKKSLDTRNGGSEKILLGGGGGGGGGGGLRKSVYFKTNT